MAPPRSVSPFASPRPLRSPRTATPKVIKRNISLCDLADDGPPQLDSLDENRAQVGKEARALLKDAQEACDEEAFQAAERAAADALQMFREIGDRSGVARALRCIVSAYQGRDELDAAYNRASEELERCRANGNKLGEAAMMMALVDLKLLQAVRPKEVISLAKSALAMVQQLKDRAWEAEGLVTLARSYENTQKGENMLRAARAAVEAFKQVGDRKGEAKVLSRKCTVVDVVDQALHYLATAASLNNEVMEVAGVF
ncbi:unnamed protein product [Symbiodinium sp. CCMP2456]|nr:unnamed protein product [Symbiodinium sp. CCMP2456]